MRRAGPPKQSAVGASGVSVRSGMTLALGALTLIAAVVVIALVALTTLLHQTTMTLDEAIERLRIVDGIESDLAHHGQWVDPARQASTEGEIRALLHEARRVDAVQEQPAVDELTTSIGRYLSAHRDARASGAPAAEAVRRSSAELAAAFEATERYGATQLAIVRAAQREAARWNQLANWIGVGSWILIVVVAGAGILWIRRFAFAAVDRIGGAMQAFRGADLAQRAPVEGPSELRAIARQFNRMAEELSEQHDRQLVFLKGVVHDLRNPLAALQLSAARLDPDRGSVSGEQLRPTVRIVRRQIELLNRMTGDLLDAASLRGGSIELSEQDRDVRELARDAVDLFADATPTHRLTLVVEETPAFVRCDPVRIEQVLNNLISNAIKYSPEGCGVTVRVGTAGGEAWISVADEGVGIPVEDLPHVFEPFRGTGASSEAARGVGLGLFATKRIVEAHGGRIEVESTPGAGSTFRVHLPRHDARLERPPAPVRPRDRAGTST